MHTNPNKSGKNFYKYGNAQAVQINATAEECFQTQSKNNLIIENNTYKDITLSQTRSE